ncbi:carboxy-S-adenosyl-L-methionine synthase CmoA [Moraxella sp. Tifton1]|uniref:Carboxy-S-adenosyl-L-methionine synthase n=1 Tax=Moraxella oculi TaxID=2940516 RepID=A0ABW8UCN4_9GAMM|nr:carboxy-S-adenosyl-L-methionine synthase CmoA [Moraxella sp. Tifton1]MCL1623047.1 carboxy-S-adenosyl-L-methionine synthase CmoA [Moraxella sp. Tifton1]
MHDTLFTTPLDKSARFSFDEEVVACFPDMIRRSVPGYGQMLAMLPILARRHCMHRQLENGQKFSRIYDLGCSLGAVSFALADHFMPTELKISAVDISAPMIDEAQMVLGEHYPDHHIEFILGDVCEMQLKECDMIVLNLTLQFLPSNKRLDLLKKCHAALADGGILILTEKTHNLDEQHDAWLVERYYDFKRANGYSELEISGKRNALENVLITDTEQAHFERLHQSGFERSLTWFKFLNFLSIVAFK